MQIDRGGLHSRPGLARRYYLAILILASVGFAMGGFEQELAAQVEPGRIRVAKESFSFVPPPGWQRGQNLPHPQCRLVYFGPTQGSFRANLNLMVDKDSGESFDDVAKQAKELFAVAATDEELRLPKGLHSHAMGARYLVRLFAIDHEPPFLGELPIGEQRWVRHMS